MPPSEMDRTQDGQSHADPTTAKKHDGYANTNGRGGRGRGRGNTKGRGGRGRGREYSDYSGRGRGRGFSESGRGRSSNKSRSPPKMKVVTCDFPSMHKRCGAARYKVHKPGCSCNKIKQARLALSITSGGNDDNKIDDSSPSNPDPTMEQLDGLVVIPETRFITLIYLCLNTSAEEFQRDSFATEKKLRSELFPPSSSSSEETVSFKASCAACLLKHEPNGFVCVSSLSRQTVDFARDLARKRADEKRNEGELHSDHAHYVCSLSKRTMWNLLDSARTRQQKRIAADQVMEQLSQQGAPAESGENVEFGHHLRSLLLMSKSSDSDTDTTHWLTLVYDDRENGEKKEPCWTIDLPGGKRHLGETTFQGAVRETEEELSLQIDEKWKLEENPRSSDETNAYYFLTPPSEMLMENITKDEFWQTPGL
jgi:hypothetical protein